MRDSAQSTNSQDIFDLVKKVIYTVGISAIAYIILQLFGQASVWNAEITIKKVNACVEHVKNPEYCYTFFYGN